MLNAKFLETKGEAFIDVGLGGEDQTSNKSNGRTVRQAKRDK